MRVALVVVGVAWSALVAGSGSAAPSSSLAEPVSYLFHAQFDIDYEVDWVETGGDRLDDCSPWWDNRGSSSVNAGSLVWIPGQLRMGTAQRAGVLRSWSLTATGARPQAGRVPPNARVEVLRRLVQRGGPAAGCPSPPPTFRAPSNDCGEKAYKTQAAALLGSTVKAYRPADGPDSLASLMSPGDKLAIRVTAPPAQHLYRKCLTTLHAPEFPNGFPVPLRQTNTMALQNLEEGETLTIRRDFAGHCKPGLGASSSCHYELHVTLKIRRWASRVRCNTGWCPNRFP